MSVQLETQLETQLPKQGENPLSTAMIGWCGMLMTTTALPCCHRRLAMSRANQVAILTPKMGEWRGSVSVASLHTRVEIPNVRGVQDTGKWSVYPAYL